ncbi:MAG TPA: glycoside hydrolase domain-containing protein [Terriglobales bacterium]|nr:glycoside hydrolase domain-containing protein [Terriglobales bacterium]
MRILFVALLAFASTAVAQTGTPAGADKQVTVWLESSLKRVYPASPPATDRKLNLVSARNQTLSFQAVIRNRTIQKLRLQCEVSAPTGISVKVRRVGYVPLPHRATRVDDAETEGIGYIPGLVPDPLFPEQIADVGPGENQSFWVTVRVPAGVQPGRKPIQVQFISEDLKTKAKTNVGSLATQIDVKPFTIQPRRDFPVTHWWYPDSVYDEYKTEPFSEKWWQITEPYLRNMTEHGSNVVRVPMFHTRREVVQRPAQLLKVREVSPGKYEFDFSPIRRFVQMAKRNGVEYFEFPHLWLYWGVRNPIQVYELKGDKWSLLWPVESPATTGVYRNFLEQFLPALRKFLDEENLPPERTFFHVSDEPGRGHLSAAERLEEFENYKKARALLKELAPWMKVMDALSDVEYGKQGVTDIPVPILSSAQKYIDAKIPHWVYFCTSPRGKYLNRLYDTPLAKIRMSGFLFYRLGAGGFLHWAYNYWYKMDTQQLENTFHEGAGSDWPAIPYGDPFVVYPGENGPIDSIRWEVFAEALQDYAILQTAGVSPSSPMLTEIKSYQEFPKNEAWIDKTVATLLANSEKTKSSD